MVASAISQESGGLRDTAIQVPQFPGKYLSLTTFRRDGTPVATPVWFVQEKGRLLIETGAGSGKVKRLSRNPTVLVAPCGASGQLRSQQVSGRAEVLGPDELDRVRGLMADKYRLDRLFVMPLFRLMQAITHRRKPDERPVIVAITPTPTGRAA